MRWLLSLTTLITALAGGSMLHAGAPDASYLMLPEPRVMGSALARPFGDSQHTVFSPAYLDTEGKPRKYSPTEFAKLGISWDTFMERAEKAADQRLAAMNPELKKDAAGKVLYAVYRGEEETIACLLIAPSLAKVFKNISSDGIWLAAPDRHSLFIFPAGPQAIADFSADLRDRFDSTAYSVTDEVFALKPGFALRAVAGLTKN